MQIDFDFEVALVFRATRVGRVHVGDVLCKNEKMGRIMNGNNCEAVQLGNRAINDR